MLNVLASVAQWEHEATGERTSAAMRHKAAQGEYTGGRAPYGFRVGGDGVRLEPEPSEQGVLASVRALRGDGRSLRAIAASLAAEGVMGRAGKPFGPARSGKSSAPRDCRRVRHDPTLWGPAKTVATELWLLR